MGDYILGKSYFQVISVTRVLHKLFKRNIRAYTLGKSYFHASMWQDILGKGHSHVMFVTRIISSVLANICFVTLTFIINWSSWEIYSYSCYIRVPIKYCKPSTAKENSHIAKWTWGGYFHYWRLEKYCDKIKPQ